MRKLLPLLLLLAPCAHAATPTLVYSQCFPPTNETNATPFHFNPKYNGSMGTGTLAGNLLIVRASYPHGQTLTISDNQSSSYTAGPKADGGTNEQIMDIRYTPNATAGITAITLTTSAAGSDFKYCVFEFSNVATSSPADGSCSSIDTGPATVDCDATFTPSTSGDLIFATGHSALGGSPMCNDPSTAVTAGSGFTPLDTERYCTDFSEFEVQAVAAAINPSFTTTGSATNYRFGAIAFKSASAGTNPTGMYISHHTRYILNTATQTIDFPSSGNLLVGAVDDINSNTGGNIVTIDTCTPSNGTWTKVSPKTSSPFDPQMFYVGNASTSTTLHCVAHSGQSGNSTLLNLWDVTGAATSPQDSSATCSSGTSGQCHNEQGSAIASPWNDRPDITPSTSSGISFAVIQIGNGPVNATCGSFLLDNTTYNGETDAGKMNNGDGWEYFFYSSTAQQSYCWNAANSSTFSSVALAFQAPATGAQPVIDKRSKLERIDP